MTKVSVIVPTHDRMEELARAVRSVLDQDFGDLELILVNDAPSLREQIEAKYADLDPRIVLLQNERNVGAAASRNRGMEEARGEYIALLDDDDIWLREKLGKQLTLLESGEGTGFVGCGYHDEWLGKDRFPRVRGNVSRTLLQTFSNIETSTVVFEAELLRRIGYIDTDLPSEQNHDFFYRMSKVTHFDYVPEVLVRKGAPAVQISRSPRNKVVGYVRYHKKHARDILRLPLTERAIMLSKFIATLSLFVLLFGDEKRVDRLYEALFLRVSR